MKIAKQVLTIIIGLIGALMIGYILNKSKNVPMFFLFSFLFNFFLSFLLLYFIPRSIRNGKSFFLILFFTCFSVLIPVLGITATSIAVVLLNYFFYSTPKESATLVILPIFNREKITDIDAIDERRIKEILLSGEANVGDKVAALAAINLRNSAAANIINYGLLSETADEIRLLAFSLLTKQEDTINNKIKGLLQKLKPKPSELIEAKIHKDLAQLYWQLVDDRLVRQDFLDFTVQKSFEYACLAIAKLPEDGSLWVLLGRIYLLKNDVYNAYDALNRATRLHIPNRKILPYLAELSFKNNNYEEMKSYLQMSGDILGNVPELSSIIRFWEEE